MLAQLGLFAAILAAGWIGTLPFDPLPLAGTIVFGAGIVIIGLAFAALGRSLSPFPEPLAQGRLVDRGPYAVVRHPIYTGVTVAFTGFALRSGSWLALGLTLVLVAFFWLKTGKEEQALRAAYPNYIEYAERVRWRLIPFLA